MNSHTPSTVPGCRPPPPWCADGRSLYDAMGPEFTLLRFDRAVDVAPLETAARQRGVPLKILDIRRPTTAIFYGGERALSRPTSMWPGPAIRCRGIWLALIDFVRGAASQDSKAASGQAVSIA
jgi:hypothetical protein